MTKNMSKIDQMHQGRFIFLLCLFGRLVQEVVSACWWNVVCAALQLCVLYLLYLIIRWLAPLMSPWIRTGTNGFLGYSKHMLDTWEREHRSRRVAWVLLVLAYAYAGFVIYLLVFKTGFFCVGILLIFLVKNVFGKSTN